MSGKKERERRQEERLQQGTEAETRARRKRLLKLGSAAAFLAIAAVAVLIVISQSQTDGGDTNIEEAGPARSELRGIPQQGLVLGDPKARVTLTEFGDLQCPACKVFTEREIPSVIESKIRSGKAKLAFSNFTIIGPESDTAGAAAIAAGEQGRGWSFIEVFYRNQGFENSGYVTDEFLTSIAKSARVPDLPKWNRDRKSEQIRSQVTRDTEMAEQLGFSGTPSFAVEGPGTDGIEALSAVSADDLEAAIDQAG